MFDEIISGIKKVATPQRILVLIIFVVLAWLLLSYSDSKGLMMDAMETGTPAASDAPAATANTDMPTGLQGRTITDPKDLLPADANSQWAALNPVNMNQNDILAADMLQAGYHAGLDTIGQSMKNANLQLRSDPPIPKQNVGPWNQSTYERDISRLPLEIGSAAASA